MRLKNEKDRRQADSKARHEQVALCLSLAHMTFKIEKNGLAPKWCCKEKAGDDV